MSKKTKILVFIPHLVGGGAEKVTLTFIKLLDKNKFDITLIILSEDYSVYNIKDFTIKVIKLNVSKTMFSIFKLRKYINDIKPDILFSSLIRGHIAVTLSMIGLRKKPFVILRSPNSPKLLLEHNQMRFFQQKMLEYALIRANLVIAQTPEMKKEIIEYYNIEKSKIKVVINPLDTDTIDEKIKNIINPFDLKYINIVAAGRITYQKGFDILIKSFKNVVKENPSFKLHIIGENENGEQEKLQQLIYDLDLTQNISFLGYQNSYQYFYFSDLYVLSSRWEGLPNTVLENLYLKKPVVATRCIPFLESLIQEGKNGLLVNVDDIDALSNAILNYKSIKLEFSDSKNQKEEINNLFKILKYK